MKKEKSNILDTEKKCLKYVSTYYTPMNLGITLMYFEQTHGKNAIQALYNYIRWSEENKEPSHIITQTIIHDLGGCQDKFMSPRSSSYLRK